MELEKKYSLKSDQLKIKKLGQFFTPYEIADFMTRWAIEDNARSLLDPAVGNGVFFSYAKKYNKDCQLKGFDIDKEIIDFFNSNSKGQVEISDFLTSTWKTKYDAIVCNPPYNRFQSIDNRVKIKEIFTNETGIKISGYTNQYILFLIKCIFQMSENGRLAFIVPMEFLNSKYGTDVKELFTSLRLLRAIISFDSTLSIFDSAVTTSCIILLDKLPKDKALFIRLNSITDLTFLNLDDKGALRHNEVKYTLLNKKDKWRSVLNNEEEVSYSNMISLSKFSKVSRGIATGDNNYFIFSNSRISESKIPVENFEHIVTRSADVNNIKFTSDNFDALVTNNKKVFLFNPEKTDEICVGKYISEGEQKRTHKKYLCAHRKPWYKPENKTPAPIWIAAANRGKIKVIRNIANKKNLTTFHGLYMHDKYSNLTNVLFCYLLTPLGQGHLLLNKKEMGNGLIKFQPSDLNNAIVLDLSVINKKDISNISKLYEKLTDQNMSSTVEELNDIFTKYCVTIG